MRESKLKSAKELSQRDFPLVATCGCFQILHTGHLQTFLEAKKYANHLLILVNSDESIKQIKGETRLFTPLQERLEVLSHLDCVDFLISFEENTPEECLKMILPEYFVKGKEYEEKEVAGRQYVGRVIFVPMQPGKSTTELARKILST